MAKNGITFTFKVNLKEKKNTKTKMKPVLSWHRLDFAQEKTISRNILSILNLKPELDGTWTWIPNVVKKFMEVDQKSIFFV